MFTRRAFLSCGIAALTAGCSSPLQSPVFGNLVSAVRFTAFGMPEVPIKRDVVATIPYASISAKIGRGPRGVLVLSHVENGDHHWISSDRAALVTRGGRIVKTAGLPELLKDTRASAVDPVGNSLHRLINGTTHLRAVDLEPDRAYDVIIKSVFEVVGEETITISEVDLEVIAIREYCEARTIRWSHANVYWADKFDGFVWKSRQHIARSFPAIDVEVLKPALPG
jgi:regulator of extracellular matrix RemA (YlzA/DUF370 family)